MKLAELLEGIDTVDLKQLGSIEIGGITLDSRKVKKGDAFFAIAGLSQHGLEHAQEAIERGASVVIYESAESKAFSLGQQSFRTVAIKNLALKLGFLADRFYQFPSKKLDVIGITGTNGKTTCSQFLAQLIPDCGVIGTLGWGEAGKLNRTLNTTPDVLTVHEILADFISLKKNMAVMEVSSHGLHQGRVDTVSFKAAVFTNLSRDHLDYHGSMDDYLQAKLLLFKQPDLQFAVVNTDDPHSTQVLDTVNKKIKCWAFSRSGKTIDFVENVTAEKVEYGLDGIKCYMRWRDERVLVEVPIVGEFNLENIMAAITVLLALGYSLEAATNKANKLRPISGRMERLGGSGKPYVFVDFAHTPDALEKVLQSLRKFCQQKLFLVFGCGGNRDKGKRATMGFIAESYANQIIITNDNPRFENPGQIIKDIEAGCTGKNVEVIQNREQAIQSAIKRAENKDCVVVAGKGHEDYQEINGIKQSFSDQEVVKQALQGWRS